MNNGDRGADMLFIDCRLYYFLAIAMVLSIATFRHPCAFQMNAVPIIFMNRDISTHK